MNSITITISTGQVALFAASAVTLAGIFVLCIALGFFQFSFSGRSTVPWKRKESTPRKVAAALDPGAADASPASAAPVPSIGRQAASR